MSGNRELPDEAAKRTTSELSANLSKGNSSTDGAPLDGGVELASEARDVIARQLRKAYDARLNEPVPDKFAKLLEALSKGDGS